MKTKVFMQEKWLKVCAANKELLKDFVLELRSNKYSPRTIEQYQCDLRMLLCYILEELENQYILDLTRKDFRQIKMWYLDEREVSSARCNRVLSSIHTMLDFAEEDDDYDYNFNLSKKVKGIPKEATKEIVFLEDCQIKRLRDYLIEHEKYRLLALLDLLYDSGARRREIWQVKKSGLLERNYTNIVEGKGGKKFPLIYFSRTQESLELYLNQRGDDCFESLWVIGEGEFRREAKISAIYCWVLEMREILSELYEKPMLVTPHSFRHSALQNMKDGTHYICKELNNGKGFGLEQLKIYAHHNDTGTTEGYLKNDDNNVLEQMFGIKIV